MLEFNEANHVAATAAAVAIEQTLAGVHQKAGLAIWVQRAESQHSAAAELTRRLPILSLQIMEQRNLLFQIVESLAIHGLLASTGRIR